MPPKPHLTYAYFYIFFFGFQALITAYFPLYCNSLGFDAWEVAVLTSCENVANFFGPLVLLTAASNRVGTFFVLTGFCVLNFLIFLLLGLSHSFWPVFSVWIACMLLTRSVVACVNQAAIRDSMDILMNFGRVRLWGSLSFIAATCVVGWLYDLFTAAVFYPVGTVLQLTLLLVAWPTAKAVSRVAEPRTSLVDSLKLLTIHDRQGRLFLGFLLATGFVWGSHAAFYTYFSIYLEALGWSGKEFSIAWTIGVLAEVILLHYFDTIQTRFSLRSIFLFSVAVAVARWLILAATDNAVVILLSQLLHAFTFAGVYVSSMKLAHIIAPQQMRGQAQNYLAAFGSGLGLFVGRLITGGTASFAANNTELYLLFYSAAAMALVAFLIARPVLTKADIVD